MINNFFSFFAADSRSPAVTFKIVGDAGNGVGMGEEVYRSVIVAVLSISKNAAGHELRQAHGAGKGAGYFGRIKSFLVRIL